MSSVRRYDKRNITAFLTALDGLQQLCKIGGAFSEHCPAGLKERAALLAALTLDARVPPNSRAPHPSAAILWDQVSDQIAAFHTMFDRRKAAKDGVIEPQKGTDADFDGAAHEIGRVEDELQAYLVGAKRSLRCSALKYFGTKVILFIYRYISRESCSRFDSPPLTC